MLRFAVEPWLTLGCCQGWNLRRKPLKSGLLTILLVAVLVVGIRILGGGSPDRLTGPVQVIDGDTLALRDHRIRLVGLDAPEIGQICTRDGQDIACGVRAKRALEAIVGEREVDCGIEAEDRYRRLLARCYLGKNDIGESLVSAGWAIATDEYHEAEMSARARQLGIWTTEFIDPAEWRDLQDRPGDRRGFWPWF